MTKHRLLIAIIVQLAVLAIQSGPVAAEKLTLPLDRLAGRAMATATGRSGDVSLSLPIPQRWTVNQAGLTFEFTNSNSVVADRSQLVVRLNDYPITQVKLLPEAPESRVEINLPVDLLLPEYNRLTFHIVNGGAGNCHQPGAPNMWTTIKLDRSSVSLDYSLDPVPLSLASVNDFVFDPKQPDPNRIHLALADLTPATLKAAAIAAAGAAMRFDYRSVEFSLSDDLQPGRDNLVIGPRDFVESVLKKWNRPKPEGDLGLGRMPLAPPKKTEGANGDKIETDSGRVYLYLTGTDPEGVNRTATAFSAMNFPWPASAETEIKQVVLPSIDRYTGRSMVRPGTKYLFSDLGFETKAMTGFAPGQADLVFKLPTDVYVKPNDLVVVSLHLVYSAGLRKDSTLRYLINDRFAGALALREETGARYRNYVIELPARLLKKGFNKISFQPRPIPLVSGECTYTNPENLSLTVYDDSIIRFPDLLHWTAMPALELLFQDGFPYARQPDWGQATVILTDETPAAAAAAINLLALVGQLNGVAPYRVEIARAWPQPGSTEADRDLLLFGRLSDLPDQATKSWPLHRGLVYPFSAAGAKAGSDKSWWAELRDSLVTPDQTRSERDPVQALVSPAQIMKSGRLLLTQWPSNLAEQRTVTAFSGAEGADLVAGVVALWRPEVRSAVKDGLALIDFGGANLESGKTKPGKTKKVRVHTQTVGPGYHLGRVGRVYWLNNLIQTYPWAALGVLLAGLIVLAWAIYRLLKIFRRRRITPEDQA